MARSNAPYLRIVADIRGRIGAGDLRPGDAVPSARRIMRDWGVAIATATKVHATLQAEGLTQVVPGVGTIVAATPPPAVAQPAPPPRRRAPAREPGTAIDLDQIVRTAIEIADDEGMAELSMRRIATDLGVATMSLYRYVAGKEELVLQMIDTALGEEPFPTVSPTGWRPRLEQVARMEWNAFRRHPWLAPTMSLTRPQMAPNAIAVTERMLNAFEGTGLSMERRLYIHLTVFSFVRGIATAFEPEAEAERETGMTGDEWMHSQEASLQKLVSSESLLLRMAMSSDFDFNLEGLFEFGLGSLLDGLEVSIGTPRPTAVVT